MDDGSDKYERLDALSIFVQCGEIEEGSPAEGIARKVIHEGGMDNLSKRQRYVYERDAQPYLEPNCKGCFCGYAPIPASELVMASMNGGYCGFCDHKMHNDD